MQLGMNTRTALSYVSQVLLLCAYCECQIETMLKDMQQALLIMVLSHANSTQNNVQQLDIFQTNSANGKRISTRHIVWKLPWQVAGNLTESNPQLYFVLFSLLQQLKSPCSSSTPSSWKRDRSIENPAAYVCDRRSSTTAIDHGAKGEHPDMMLR